MESTHILIMASHNTSIVKRLCTKALWMENGLVKASGPIDEVVKLYEADGKSGQPGGGQRLSEKAG
jgi:ABC-type polysaccharide/polyol phosphate transport system ATPase subunit